MSSVVADAPALARIDDTGQETNGMTVLEQLPGKVEVYSSGERSLTLLMTSSRGRFCEAVRGLQVVCYACSLGDGDKAARAFQVQEETRSRALGMSPVDILCHRLFCNDNSNKDSGCR